FTKAHCYLQYQPGKDDPKGERIHWIQFVNVDKNTAKGWAYGEYFIDGRDKNVPYYDAKGAATPEGFVDDPKNSPAYGAKEFRARALLVEETAAKTVRIWQGVSWGYTYSEKKEK